MDIHEAKNRSKAALLALPNVIGVGVGPKLRQGESSGEMAIKVFVSRKVLAADLSDDERVPKSLDGYATDVEVMDKPRAR